MLSSNIDLNATTCRISSCGYTSNLAAIYEFEIKKNNAKAKKF